MAAVVWPAALDTVEGRWGFRFGKPKVDRLRACLGRILKRTSPEVPLPALLAQVLSTFAVEFNRKSPAPLDLCASVLRVLARGPVAVREIPLLTGSSPEMTAIGWRLKPFVIVSTVQGRGKVASLTPAGIKAHRAYVSLLKRVEERWRERFGSTIADLKGTLAGIFEVREGGRSKLAMGMSPPPGTVRGGEIAPSLGRRALGPAARRRARDLVVQTQAFMRDPANALPHYPLWDMNRGFGP